MANAKNIIRLTSETELEAIHTETFINTTNGKVTKVTDESALRGMIRGNVKTAKKALKDITLAISHLFPDLAFDTTLDSVAEQAGISPRFAAAQSSTWVRLVGDEGTVFQAGVHVASDNKGNLFDLEEDVTIGAKGYDYGKIRSQQSGAFTNVDPYTIVNMNPEPAGFVGLLNEYGATGGRDAEDDDTFRQRIKEGPDLLAEDTLSKLAQVFAKINTNVLRVVNDGTSQTGKVILSILTVNGIDLTDDELQTLLEQGGRFLALTELAPIGTNSYGVELKNATYSFIDVDFRLEMFSGADFTQAMIDVQQKFSKLVDFRFWDSSLNVVQWEDLLFIVKNVQGVKNVSDKYFIPNVDLSFANNEFPRFRGFIVRDLLGNVITDQGNENINPIFYPSEVNQSLQSTVL